MIYTIQKRHEFGGGTMTITREQADKILEILYRIAAEQRGLELVSLKITHKDDFEGKPT